jgi:hypothetical protein
MRRGFGSKCLAFGNVGLVAQRVLDVSPRGMLIRCEHPVKLGELVHVNFRAPGRDDLWLDAEAEIARIIHGERQRDPGYCAGLRFTLLDRVDRDELLTRLAGLPPPIPLRRPRVDYASTVSRVFYA